MPYKKLLADFNKNNGYTLNVERPVNLIEGVVPTYQDPEMIDDTIKEFIISHYLDQAKEYERHRQRMIIRSNAKPSNKKLKDDVSKMADAQTFLESYIGALRLVADKEAKLAEENKVYRDYEYKRLPLFGMTGNEFASLLNKHFNSYSYEEGRRYQLLDLKDIKYPTLLDESNSVQKIADDGKNCKTADESEKEKIYKTYITKEIIKERLASKNFLWKFIFRGETKAMKEYIKSAEDSLNAVNFDKDAKIEAEKFAKQGYAMLDPAQKSGIENYLNDKVQAIDNSLVKPLEERNAAKKAFFDAERLKQEKKEKEKEKEKEKKETAKIMAKAKTEKIHSEVEMVNSKEDMIERFFEVRFRPSFDKQEFDRQVEIYKSMDKGALKEVTRAQEMVVKENAVKFNKMKQYFKLIANANEEDIQMQKDKYSAHFAETENDLLAKIPDDYEPVTSQKLAELEKVHLSKQIAGDINAEDKAEKQEIVEPKENLGVKKDITK